MTRWGNSRKPREGSLRSDQKQQRHTAGSDRNSRGRRTGRRCWKLPGLGSGDRVPVGVPEARRRSGVSRRSILEVERGKGRGKAPRDQVLQEGDPLAAAVSSRRRRHQHQHWHQHRRW